MCASIEVHDPLGIHPVHFHDHPIALNGDHVGNGIEHQRAPTGMQSLSAFLVRSSAPAAAPRPLSVSVHRPDPPRNAPNSVRGENHVPAMLVAAAVFDS